MTHLASIEKIDSVLVYIPVQGMGTGKSDDSKATTILHKNIIEYYITVPFFKTENRPRNAAMILSGESAAK